MAELPVLGQHCSFQECSQLDFLPILCYGCKQIYCKLHSAYDKHSCTRECQQKTLPEFSGVKSYKCDVEDCKKTELTPVICDKCGKNFCLQHRHQVDHKCVAYEPPKERMLQTKEHVKNILETRNNPLATDTKKTKNVRGHKSKATAAKVALMKIKMSAIGNKGLPDNERIYVKVILPLGSKEKFAHVFFSNKWSVGKTVDYIADLCKLDNRNNVTSAKKLRLFDRDNGNGMEFAESVENCIAQGIFFSGSTLILEYVDHEINTLDDLELYKQ